MKVFLFLSLLIVTVTMIFARREWKYEGTWTKCEDGLQTFHSETYKEMDGYRRICPSCEGTWSACKDGVMKFQVEDESDCTVVVRTRPCK